MMKTFIFLMMLATLTVSCSNQTKHAVYDMMHEKQRQDCLKQGRSDCQRAESYEKYKKKRDEVIK